MLVNKNIYLGLGLILISVIIIENLILNNIVNINNKNKNKNKNNENDENNLQKKEELNELFCKIIKERVEKLNSMSYKDWINYNQKNVVVEYKNNKYYIFVDEKITDENYVSRVSYYSDYVNMNYTDFVELLNDRSNFFTINPISKTIQSDLYNLSEWKNGCGNFSYFWTSPFNDNLPIKKNSTVKKYIKNENGNLIKGIIGIGYPEIIYGDIYKYYYEYIENYTLVIYFIFIFLFVFGLFYFSNNLLKSLFIFFILNLVFYLSMINKDQYDDYNQENNLINSLNTSILGTTFLFSANIFILDVITKLKMKIFLESVFIFSFGSMSLLLAMISITDFKNTDDIKKHRIKNQLFYNAGVILNLFFLVNFFTTLFTHKK